MFRAVARIWLPAAKPASTIARPKPRELPVTNQTCAIHPPTHARSLRAWGSLRSPRYFFPLLCGCTRGALDYLCNFFGMRDEDAVAGARNFGRLALGPLGVPAFQVRVDGSIASGHHHPTGFGSPRSGGDGPRKIW